MKTLLLTLILMLIALFTSAYPQNCAQLKAKAARVNSSNQEFSSEEYLDYRTMTTVEEMSKDFASIEGCVTGSSGKQIHDLVAFERQIELLMLIRAKSYVDKVGLSGALLQETGTSNPSGSQVWSFMERHGIHDNFLASDRATIAKLKAAIEAAAAKKNK